MRECSQNNGTFRCPSREPGGLGRGSCSPLPQAGVSRRSGLALVGKPAGEGRTQTEGGRSLRRRPSRREEARPQRAQRAGGRSVLRQAPPGEILPAGRGSSETEGPFRPARVSEEVHLRWGSGRSVGCSGLCAGERRSQELVSRRRGHHVCKVDSDQIRRSWSSKIFRLIFVSNEQPPDGRRAVRT